MKVVAVNGSPHQNGTTHAALSLVVKELKKQDIEVELFQIGNQPIQGCTACGACGRLGKCIFEGDIVNPCIKAMEGAEGLLIGSPVYYSGIAGSMKCFLDRLFYAGGASLQYKVGTAVAALRRSGGVDTFHQLNNYFNLANIIITPSRYWNVVHGMNGEELMQDEEGVQNLKMLGRNMAWLMKTIELGKKTLPIPEKLERIGTNYIH